MSETVDPDDAAAQSVLQRFVRNAAKRTEESCDLCAEPIGATHRHLLDLSSRQVLCACRACTVLFNQPAAGAGARKLIPTRSRYLAGFDMSDIEWDDLRVPVNMAFFFHNSAEGGIAAYYPSPMGPTESLLTLESWEELARRNAVLRQMEPDVEALLVNRVGSSRDYFLVPIDECYRLIGIVRTYWRGLSGGKDVWRAIDEFFAGLKQQTGAGGGRDA